MLLTKRGTSVLITYVAGNTLADVELWGVAGAEVIALLKTIPIALA